MPDSISRNSDKHPRIPKIASRQSLSAKDAVYSAASACNAWPDCSPIDESSLQSHKEKVLIV